MTWRRLTKTQRTKELGQPGLTSWLDHPEVATRAVRRSSLEWSACARSRAHPGCRDAGRAYKEHRRGPGKRPLSQGHLSDHSRRQEVQDPDEPSPPVYQGPRYTPESLLG